MPVTLHPRQPIRPGRARLLAGAILASGVLLAGCGGSSGTPAATGGSVSTAGSQTATSDGATGSGRATPGAGGSRLLAFAKCMRANGVPNFPDPGPGRGAFEVPAGGNPAAPAFQAASAKCQKLVPGGGLPGSGPPPSAQTLAKLRRIAVCMRQHGVPQFPDPRSSVPANLAPGGFQVLTDFDGAILLFPTTINLQAPAYRQALAACGAPPLGLPH